MEVTVAVQYRPTQVDVLSHVRWKREVHGSNMATVMCLQYNQSEKRKRKKEKEKENS